MCVVVLLLTVGPGANMLFEFLLYVCVRACWPSPLAIVFRAVKHLKEIGWCSKF